MPMDDPLNLVLVTEKFHYPHFFQSYVTASAVSPVRDTHNSSEGVQYLPPVLCVAVSND